MLAADHIYLGLGHIYLGHIAAVGHHYIIALVAKAAQTLYRARAGDPYFIGGADVLQHKIVGEVLGWLAGNAPVKVILILGVISEYRRNGMQLCHPLKVVAGSQGTVGVKQIKMPVNNGLVQLRLKGPPYAVSFFGGNPPAFIAEDLIRIFIVLLIRIFWGDDHSLTKTLIDLLRIALGHIADPVRGGWECICADGNF